MRHHYSPIRFRVTFCNPFRQGPVGWLALLFWVFMLAGHTPGLLRLADQALAGAWIGGTGMRFALMLGSSLFFLFKCLGGRFLEVSLDSRGAVALTALVVLLHAGLLTSPLPTTLETNSHTAAIILLVATVAVLPIILLPGALGLRADAVWCPSRSTATQRYIGPETKRVPDPAKHYTWTRRGPPHA